MPDDRPGDDEDVAENVGGIDTEILEQIGQHLERSNTRSHFHPPPDATTPGDDAEYASDWRDILSSVLEDLDDRIEAFWE